MKTYSLDELRELAKQVFEKNPASEKVYATHDGQVFREGAKNSADNHARAAGGMKPLTVHIITKDEAYGKAKKEPAKEPGTGTGAEGKKEGTENPDQALFDLIDKATDAKLLTKTGNFYNHGDKRIGQGKKQVVQHLKENAELLTLLQAGIAQAKD